MPYLLGDIFIGDFPLTQNFGANADVYSARFGMKGHNGLDLAAPSLTQVLSAADGWVSEIGFDPAGYGKYIKVVHNGYLTLYAHLNDTIVAQNDKVVAGQLIAHSNNTGFSSGPHLHFGVAPCDTNGQKTQAENGYAGYIDPQGPLCQWTIKNLSVPVVQINEPQPPVAVPAEDFVTMVAQGTNYKVVANYLVLHGINDFLTREGTQIIDLSQNPKDSDGGAKTVAFINSLFNRIEEGTPPPPPPPVDPLQVIDQAAGTATTQAKTAFFSAVLNNLKSFIFSGK